MEMIHFKNLHVLSRMFEVAWHPNLINLLMWMVVRYSKMTVTSPYRPKAIHDRDSGIHSTIPLRAFDIRSRDFPEPIAITNDINKHWIYDPKRTEMKCAIYHNTGAGFHIHLQVHANSKLTWG